MNLYKLESYLQDLYNSNTYEDYCYNGIQIEGNHTLEKILFGVSLSDKLIDYAIEFDADCIIVHHGIFYKGLFSLKGLMKKRVGKLIHHNISLLGFHLPMDAHPEMGHNILLSKELELNNLKSYSVGFIGLNANNYNRNMIIQKLKNYLGINKPLLDEYKNMSVDNFTVYDKGPNTPKNICIISGGSAHELENAALQDVDTFICGSINEQTPAIASELGINFINVGHYYSELPGIIALEKYINTKFNLITKFVRINNCI